ncbi:unnamed protein product [marine sediment metagenome]|uniref:Uncharacterized protein n=1 Tax=marine sediment metagenome TaxID=412755 RepID=X1ADC0_9ZZZZ
MLLNMLYLVSFKLIFDVYYMTLISSITFIDAGVRIKIKSRAMFKLPFAFSFSII